MARLITSAGKDVSDFASIRARLAKLGISLNGWAPPEGVRAKQLLDQQSLNDAEKDELLKLVESRFEHLKKEKGYVTRDLVVMHEDVPGIGDMLNKFNKIHYHTDDEVRYILAGRGYFGFVEADGGQFLLEVTAGDYINVPANTEHWFELRDSKRIKAVRYFIDTSGWAPVYTERHMAAFA